MSDRPAKRKNALHVENGAGRQTKWKKENKVEIDAWNRLVEEDGLWPEKYQDE
jgi:post-segregation antitoxin (ccd killing protein)